MNKLKLIAKSLKIKLDPTNSFGFKTQNHYYKYRINVKDMWIEYYHEDYMIFLEFNPIRVSYWLNAMRLSKKDFYKMRILPTIFKKEMRKLIDE